MRNRLFTRVATLVQPHLIVFKRRWLGRLGKHEVLLDNVVCAIDDDCIALSERGPENEVSTVPTTLGAWFGGTVAAVGANVNHLEVGQKVAATRTARWELGAMSPHTVVAAADAIAVAPDVDVWAVTPLAGAVEAMVETHPAYGPLARFASASDRLDDAPRRRRSAAVIGTGADALLTASLLLLELPVALTVVGESAADLERAERYLRPDVASYTRLELIVPEDAPRLSNTADVVFDTLENRDAQVAARTLVSTGGTIRNRTARAPYRLDAVAPLPRGVSLLRGGGQVGMAAMRYAAWLIEAGLVDPAPLAYRHTFGQHEVQRAFEAAGIGGPTVVVDSSPSVTNQP